MADAYVIRQTRPGAFAVIAMLAAGVALMGAAGVANAPAIVLLDVFLLAALYRAWRASEVVRLSGAGVRLGRHPLVAWADVDAAVVSEGMLVVRPRGATSAPAVPLEGLAFDPDELTAAFAHGGVVLRDEV